MLQVQLSFQKDMTPEEQAIYDALQAELAKDESCKQAAETSKRPREDEDPDPNSQ